MNGCGWTKQVGAFFDGENPAQAARVEAHLAACPECAAYVTRLQSLRSVATTNAARVEISDGQFPVFMAGIRDGIETPAPRSRGLWAAVSLTAAALLVSLALFAVFDGGLGEVKATEVESFSTDLEGATVHSYDSPSGVTLWVDMAKDDVL